MAKTFGRSSFLGNGALIGVAMMAALGCYTISLKVSSERAAVDRLRAQVVADAQDIRLLQSELRTRARLPELQRWNDSVLALSAPSAQQFVRDEVQLARFAPGAPQIAAPVQTAATPAPAVKAAPLLPAAPRPANQLAPGMKTINYIVPATSRVRMAPTTVTPAKSDAAAVTSMAARTGAGLDSTLLETVANAADLAAGASPANAGDSVPKSPNP